MSSSDANRAFWDRYSDEYQELHASQRRPTTSTTGCTTTADWARRWPAEVIWKVRPAA